MITYILLFTPPVLLLIYLASCYIIGQPPAKSRFNVLLSLLLLIYFTATVSLGIFWVANQELPVFDIHYLFGYITIILAIVHVASNWKRIVNFFVKKTPSSEDRNWLPGIRFLGYSVLIAFLGLCCFWIGLSRGSRKIEYIQT